MSAYMEVSPFMTCGNDYQTDPSTVHIFRNHTTSTWREWTKSCWSAAGKSKFRLPDDPKLKELLEWHYKHSVIACWGSLELQQRTRLGFRLPGDVEVASVCLECGFAPISSSGVESFCWESGEESWGAGEESGGSEFDVWVLGYIIAIILAFFLAV